MINYQYDSCSILIVRDKFAKFVNNLDCASKDKNELKNVLKDRYESLRSKIIKEIKNYLISSL